MVKNCSEAFSIANKTCGADQIWISTEEAIVICVLCSVSAIVGSLGNVLVIAAVVTSTYLHTVPDFFFVSLSIADLLVTAIAQPMMSYNTFVHPVRTKRTYDAYNMITSFIGHLALLASITSMTAITLERLIAIRFPLRYVTWITVRRSFMAIAVLWFVSFTLTLIYIVPQDVNRMGLWAYVTTNLVVTIAVYVYIFGVAKRHENMIVAVQPDTKSKSQPGARDQRVEQKAAKTTAIIVGVFLLFWLPLILFAGIHGAHASGGRFLRGFRWVQVVSMCNSAVNPYVYCIRSTRYRSAIARIIRLKNVDVTLNQQATGIRKPSNEAWR